MNSHKEQNICQPYTSVVILPDMGSLIQTILVSQYCCIGICLGNLYFICYYRKWSSESSWTNLCGLEAKRMDEICRKWTALPNGGWLPQSKGEWTLLCLCSGKPTNFLRKRLRRTQNNISVNFSQRFSCFTASARLCHQSCITDFSVLIFYGVPVPITFVALFADLLLRQTRHKRIQGIQKQRRRASSMHNNNPHERPRGQFKHLLHSWHGVFGRRW